MWNYEKRLQYPVKITKTNPKIAQIILTQYGGPDGELGASMRYLSQRYTMPYQAPNPAYLGAFLLATTFLDSRTCPSRDDLRHCAPAYPRPDT